MEMIEIDSQMERLRSMLFDLQYVVKKLERKADELYEMKLRLIGRMPAEELEARLLSEWDAYRENIFREVRDEA
ncbi:MAG: hypothetical protein QW561_01300 [Candidatus Aenigmatarchaeota archaeon]